MHRILRIPASITAMFILTAGTLPSAVVSAVPLSVSPCTTAPAWMHGSGSRRRPMPIPTAMSSRCLRVGMAQRIHRWDWQLELSQPAMLDAPSDAVSSVTAQGQLGLGGTYYASNTNSYPAAAFLKQGFARYHGESANLRLGRFEFFDGRETQPKNTTIRWLQANRISDTIDRQLRLLQRPAQLRRSRCPLRRGALEHHRDGRPRRSGRLQHERQPGAECRSSISRSYALGLEAACALARLRRRLPRRANRPDQDGQPRAGGALNRP